MESPFPKDEQKLIEEFDSLCLKSLKGEAVDYYRQLGRLRTRNIFFSEMPEAEFEKMRTVDKYFFENEHFIVMGYDIEIKNELLSEALKGLTDRRIDVVLSSYFLGMSDTDIARKMHLVKSTVNEHKKTSLKILKKTMEGFIYEEKKK